MIFNGYKFRGIHASYVKFLSTDKGAQREEGLNIFTRVLDVYMIGALVGIAYNRRSKIDDSINNSSDIPSSVMVSEQEMLLYIYRIVLLCDTSTNLTEKERINRAFKTDSDEQAVKNNLILFNSYVLGGIELLYERFENCFGSEDEKFNNILELIDNFYEIQPPTNELF